MNKTKPKIVLDFETYYNTKDGYSLRKLPNFQYVSDPRFKAHGLSVVEESDPHNGYWIPHDEIPDFIKSMDGFKDWTVIAHNAYFDMLILAFHYNCIPPSIIDTMGMANVLVYPITGSASLQVCSKYYGLSGKIAGTLQSTDGIRDLDAETMESLGEYAIQDSYLTWNIYTEMAKEFPEAEYPILNLHIQMYLNRRMRIDAKKLMGVYQELEDTKKQFEEDLRRLWPEETKGIDVWKAIRATSGEFLVGCIKKEGLLPPRKRSPQTGKLVYAFAKTDLQWIAMRSHGEKMAVLVDAKLFASSTIVTRRAERFLTMYNQMGGWAHPLLNYCRARTGRSSGGDKLNLQNLPKKPEAFRNSFVPPDNHKVVICDSGQIEARVLAYLAGQHDLLNDFRVADQLSAEGEDPKAAGKDVYTMMATKIGSDNRQLGKATVLGCGFGMGRNTFVLNAKADPFMQVTEEDLHNAWNGWRHANQKIVQFWDAYEKAFTMTALARREMEISGIIIKPYKETGVKVILPSGRFFLYHDVRKGPRGLVDARGSLWFGCLVENLVQAFARDVVFYQSVECEAIVNNLWIMVHDEVDLVVREEEVEEVSAAVMTAFCTPPEWCNDLPVIGEVAVADYLIKA